MPVPRSIIVSRGMRGICQNGNFSKRDFPGGTFSAPTAKRGTAVGLPQHVFLRLFAVHRQRTATQTVESTQARHNRVAQFLGTLYRKAPANLDVQYNLSSRVLSVITR